MTGAFIALAIVGAFIAAGDGIKPLADRAAVEEPALVMQVTKTYMDGRVEVEPPVRFRMLQR